VAVPIIIFVVCLTAGVWASSRWLPDLARGSVGGFAFFVVCGLLGAAFAALALNIYVLVRDLEASSGVYRATFTADILRAMLFDVGTLVGFALAVYLLAPKRTADGRG
jgi:hypothetical protein